MANSLGVPLCKSDYPEELGSAVTFKAFPSLPSPAPPETTNKQGEAAAQHGTYMLHSYHITVSLPVYIGRGLH